MESAFTTHAPVLPPSLASSRAGRSPKFHLFLIDWRRYSPAAQQHLHRFLFFAGHFLSTASASGIPSSAVFFFSSLRFERESNFKSALHHPLAMANRLQPRSTSAPATANGRHDVLRSFIVSPWPTCHTSKCIRFFSFFAFFACFASSSLVCERTLRASTSNKKNKKTRTNRRPDKCYRCCATEYRHLSATGHWQTHKHHTQNL